MFDDRVLVLAKAVIDDARKKKLTIATAESCTGGLIASALTEIPGASDVVTSGFVVYSNQAKIKLLGIKPLLVTHHGAVSEEVARAMAEAAREITGASLTVSCTGIAGPSGGTRQKPIGLVHIAAARRGEDTLWVECRFGDIGRTAVRLRSVEAALKLLLQLL